MIVWTSQKLKYKTFIIIVHSVYTFNVDILYVMLSLKSSLFSINTQYLLSTLDHIAGKLYV